ncbi:MAG: hypothetical protein P8Y23_01470 [Candidatus Lokiarchaeota archaeon]|jgi:hypothetical protein
MNEVFYELKERKNPAEVKNENQYEIIFHFLGKVDQNTVLYETKQLISKADKDSIDIIANNLLKSTFQEETPIKLVKGKIREIFLSYSS